VEYTKRFLYQSKQWYNDGLKKANIRDLSGAIQSLKKSLYYNRDNVPARNLLGLVYYGRGEVSEALVEWIISKNIKASGNIATYYIKKVQESPSELDVINQAIKKYNQCLMYCEQGGEDLAAIQLTKVVAAHPTFLKAYQLLALIYLQSEQFAKARQMIRRAHKLDTTNETTLRYMHELKELRSDKAAKIRDTKDQAISYKLGNETIIQPVSASLKDNATMLTIVNIVIGIMVGAMVVWFLFVPSVKQKMTQKTNKEVIAYSEQIAALESEIDSINKELSKYKAESDATANEMAIAQGTKGSYEGLVAAIAHYNDEKYSRSALADELLAIKTESLGEVGKATYDKIAEVVFEE
jgi:Flp pilus assembly protein TadD